MAIIMVTGSGGQLGQEIVQLHSAFPHHTFHFFSRQDLDISNEAEVQNIFKSLKPQFCINCAAYTAVDKAETEREKAFAINALGVKYLAANCAAAGTQFIHISTDYVFDGMGTSPYNEDHPIAPANVYGESKASGEAYCMEEDPAAIIIRTSWVYSSYGNNFVKTMLRLMGERPGIRVVADQWGSPTYAADLAEAILQIIDSTDPLPGIYHYSNEGAITWFDFAQQIAAYISSSCTVLPITTADYPTPAKRPAYSVMDLTKVRRELNISPEPWESSLKKCLQQLSSLP